MLDNQRFKTWNIFDCGLHRGSTGYNYWEAKALTEELVRQQRRVRIFSHRIAPRADRFPEAEVVPTFSLALYSNVSKDPTSAATENFVVQNEVFHRDLMRLDSTMFRDSLALFPMITENQLLGLLQWLRTLQEEARPDVAISLFEPKGEWTPTNSAVRYYQAVWSNAPESVKRRVRMFSRSPQSATKFAAELGIPASVYWCVVPERYFVTGKNRPADGDMVIAFLGGARRERGSELIADVLKQCGGLGVRFILQVRVSESDINYEELKALSTLDHVRLEFGELDRDEFYRIIRDSVVLLPYKPSPYRWRASGIYQEAKLLDAPVLVTAGTWMAEEVQASGNGMVIDEFSVRSIVACIPRARAQLPALKAAAARVGKHAREQHGTARCIAAIAAAFSGAVAS